MDYPCSVGENRPQHRGPTGRPQAGQTQDGSDDGHPVDTSSLVGFPKSTTSAVLLRPFLANVTIGFADGLTVPFALTAGLSWLGSSHMVITAGFAEICAGCVSMGIGGYLAADGERKAEAREAAKEAAAEEAARERRASTSSLSSSTSLARALEAQYEARADGTGPDLDLLHRYLEPLNLPPHLATAGSDETNAVREAPSSPAASIPVGMSPVVSGLSVSFGYLSGGLLPLFPYFFVNQVQNGLVWSFIVCVVALFAFGAIKEPPSVMFGSLRQWMSRARRVSREHVKSSLWDGWRMAWLGSIAALVAVLCVMVSQLILVDPVNVDEAETELLEAILASYGNGTFPIKA
ncbi:VIT family-domain-containing protein [Rhypophila decipiens]|uniref:VIT family-domain-containing protein n=1 Tax=Rhypophila decipiens TaxID=261697 RepID=A0AAN6XWY0_9PEZI|nr:VIT family-domain-containing protein [Rhypophila decipiens]